MLYTSLKTQISKYTIYGLIKLGLKIYERKILKFMFSPYRNTQTGEWKKDIIRNTRI